MYKNELIPEPLLSFLKYSQGIQGKSENTVNEYFYDIRTFYRFLKIHYKLVQPTIEFNEIDIMDFDISCIRKITLEDIYEFIFFLSRDKQNHSATIARKTASLRSYFKYLHTKVKLIDINPITELDNVKLKKQLPKYFSVEDSISLLNAVDGKYSERDYCILTLFLNCGMRLSELVNINISDVRGDIITIIGKGNKERTVYLNDACIAALENYLTVRKSMPVDALNKNALFLSARGKRISRRTVQHLVEKYVKKIGLDSHKYTTHKLRHTAATLMYQSGVDIRALQEILGHEQLSTTEIYTHVDNQQLRTAVSKNPLNNINKSIKKD